MILSPMARLFEIDEGIFWGRKCEQAIVLFATVSGYSVSNVVVFAFLCSCGGAFIT
jgi:hypothetical protein